MFKKIKQNIKESIVLKKKIEKFSEEIIGSVNLVVNTLINDGRIFLCGNDVTPACAKLLNEDNLIAFFQGRMEAGPRALGNRSILGNPTNASILDKLNKKVKFRQPWRPFCPTILDEFKDEYFIKTTQSHYMINAFDVTEKCKLKAPAVVHIDNTARPQFLLKEKNPLFYKLIYHFYKITGVPVLINTSLNIKGEPICMNPNEALNFFFMTEIDFLCIGNYIVINNSSN